MIREIMASRLKYYRQRSGLTIYEVGARIGRNGKTISAWENGRGQPDADMLLALCKLYCIDSISELFGETMKDRYIDLSDDERHLIDMYRTLTDRGKAYISSTVDMAVDAERHNAYDAQSKTMEVSENEKAHE